MAAKAKDLDDIALGLTDAVIVHMDWTDITEKQADELREAIRLGLKELEDEDIILMRKLGNVPSGVSAVPGGQSFGDGPSG